MPPAAPTESLHGFLPFMRLILHVSDCLSLSFSVESAALYGVSLPLRIGLTIPFHADCEEWMESKVKIWHRISETLRVKMPLQILDQYASNPCNDNWDKVVA